MMSEVRKLTFFISSPGDVYEERTLAQRVMDRLQSEFAGRAVLEPVFWEHEPLLATDTFQTQISKPSDSDVMIAILWSRLGTRLPKDFTREDGSRYESGTEFEFEDAVRGFRDSGKPQLLVYRKMAKASVQLDDEDALMERIDQKKKLDSFINRWFHDTEEGTLKAAFHPFESASEFELVLERHLRKIIQRALPESAEADFTSTAVWKQGSPYRGLQTFDFEHAPIFFGRTKAIGDVLDALRRQASEGRAFVLVIGMSGGGKSSLARAGVMPMLTQPGVIEGVGMWRRATYRPSDVRGDLFLGLATALLRDHGLRLPDMTPEELGEVLRQSPTAALALIKTSLAQDATELAQQGQGGKNPTARLALLVDQMEEIFTQDWVTDKDRERFIECLDKLARSGRVWVVSTFRSDLYPRCTKLPKLVELKEGSGQYDLMPPTATEIGQMVRLPTRAAGLRFEEDPSSNERLDDMLRDAAAARPELLPLLQFTLQELYERRRDDGTLTLEAYHELGGVEGSLAKRAEAVFEQLPEDVRAALPKVLEKLVHVRSGAQEAIGRRRAHLDDFDEEHQKQLVDAFIEARLFVTELDEDVAAVMVTHEALLWHWPRVQEWVEQNRENLRVHSRVSAASERWIRENRNADLLLPTGKPLEEGKSLLEIEATLNTYERAFIDASIAAERKRQNIKRAVVAMLAVLAITASLAAVFATQQRKRADAERARAEVEAQTAKRTSDFLVGLFEVSDPSEARGNEITAREILEAGAGRIDRELSDEPETQAKLMETIGKVYTSLGLLDQAVPLLERSVAQRRSLADPAQDEIASSLDNLGYVLALKSELEPAETAYVEALEARRAIYGESHPLVADTLTGLAYVKTLAGEFETAEALLREALEMRRSALGERHEAVAENLEELGLVLFEQGLYEQAENLLGQALDMRRELLGTEPHPDVSENINNLAVVVYTQGRSRDAENLFREALEMKRALLDESHPEIAIGMNNLAFLLHDNGDLEAAERMYEGVLDIQTRVLGPSHPEVAVTMINLASVLNDAGRRDEAIERARQSLEIRREAYEGEHPEVAKGMMTLAQWLSRADQQEEAEALLRDALKMRERLLAGTHPDVAMSRVALGNLLVDQSRFDEGCALGAGAPDLLSEPLGEDHWRVAVARSLVGACKLAEGDAESAETYLLLSLERLKDETGARNSFRNQTLKRLADMYETTDRPAEAARYRRMLDEASLESPR
jgi:tetratricopeptide (TPR) repeat protein